MAEVVGIENRLPGVVEDCAGGLASIRVRQNRLRAPGQLKPGTRVIVCLRPENIRISRDSCPADDSNRLTGVILKSVAAGMMHQRITLDCDGMLLVALLERRTCVALKFAERERITIIFSFGASHIIIAD